VLEVAREAATTARDIIDLREQHRQLIQDRMGNLMVGLQLLDLFYEETHLTVRIASDRLNVSYPTANGLMTGLEELGITEETTGQARYRVYRYSDYLELLRREV
jgi:Fic family protein